MKGFRSKLAALILLVFLTLQEGNRLEELDEYLNSELTNNDKDIKENCIDKCVEIIKKRVPEEKKILTLTNCITFCNECETSASVNRMII